eukprot:CAMPEP_0180553426 /NCGR_PEP_ID=MMETSP1036_2-20121128/74333_1 /TAXON_ID=632150 /ORGANISM="Azadinium spinosum, Strain 3D9" /LENGTH=37 /DNA_ID= /DNA_START= /DNA_END= /DNA_ORIENTATION=
MTPLVIKALVELREHMGTRLTHKGDEVIDGAHEFPHG